MFTLENYRLSRSLEVAKAWTGRNRIDISGSIERTSAYGSNITAAQTEYEISCVGLYVWSLSVNCCISICCCSCVLTSIVYNYVSCVCVKIWRAIRGIT